jgi:ubiquinone/menaquinone biosynthesis C-methylase UbiE
MGRHSMNARIGRSGKSAFGLTSFIKQIWQLIFCVLYVIFSIPQVVALALFPKKNVRNMFARIEEKEFQARLAQMAPHLSARDRVLDIGAGTGRFGFFVQQALGIRVMGVDVLDYAEAPIEMHIYDGQRLPFADASFDACLLVFVLHHCRDHDAIFQEALRVARKRVIVFEDTYDSVWQMLFVKWNDFQTNILQGLVKVLKGLSRIGITKMPLPLTFRSVQAWRDYFSRYPVTIEAEELRDMGYKPLTKAMFCLKRKPRSGGQIMGEGERS